MLHPQQCDWSQEISGLEVIGSSRPSTSVPVCRSPVQVEELQEEEEEQERMEEDLTWEKKKTFTVCVYSLVAAVKAWQDEDIALASALCQLYLFSWRNVWQYDILFQIRALNLNVPLLNQLLVTPESRLLLPRCHLSSDPLAQFDDVQSDSLLIPALKFCDQLARWTGNSAIDQVKQLPGLFHISVSLWCQVVLILWFVTPAVSPLQKFPIPQGKVGISATLFLEALSGESVSSPVELHNEGSTAIFYQWERLEVPRSLAKLRSFTRNTCFYFNQSSGECKHNQKPASATLLQIDAK